MTILDDLNFAVVTYPTNSCATEIVNFSIEGGGGPVLNVGDKFRFQVRLTNQGQLHMRNVRLKALGSQFADVRTLDPDDDFGPSALSGAFDLDVHQPPHLTGQFQGRAKLVTNGPQDIVSAGVASWDASLDHMLIIHSVEGVDEGKLNRVILPQQ